MGGGFFAFLCHLRYLSRPPTKFIRLPTGRINLFDLGWRRKRGMQVCLVQPAPIKRRNMFEPFVAYDGTSINNEQELQDWMVKNNKRQVAESVEELEQKEKITKEREEREEFQKAKATIRKLQNTTLDLSRRKKDRSVKSNINLRGIRNKEKKIKSLTKLESTRIF